MYGREAMNSQNSKKRHVDITPMNKKRVRVSHFLLVLTLVAMTGCASTGVRFQDYVSTVKRDAAREVDYGDNHNPQPVYISVADAQAAVDLLSDAYMDASRQDRNASTVTDIAVLTSAVATAFIALVDENPVEARKVGLGGILFSLVGERVNNPAYRQIYLEGAQALNCVHEASTRLPGVVGLKLLKLDRLLAKQATDIKRVKTTLNTYEDALGAIKLESTRKSIHSAYKSTVEDANTQVLRAEYMANSIEDQLTLIDPRGRQLLNKARQIHIEVEKELVYNEYRSLSFNGALQKVFASGGGSSLLDFSSLKPVVEGGDASTKGDKQATGADLPPKMSNNSHKEFKANEISKEEQKIIDAHESIKAAVERLKATNMEINRAITQLAKEPLSFSETAFDSCPFAPPTLRDTFRLDIAEYEITLPAEGTAYKETVTIPILGGVSPYTPLKGGLPEEATKIKRMGNGYALVVTLDSTKVTLDSDKRISVRDSRNNESSLHIKVTRPSADPKLTLDSEQVKRVQEYLKGVLGQETTNALIAEYKVQKFVDSKWGKATEEAIKTYLKVQENSTVPTERQKVEKLKKHEFDGKVIYVGADGQYTPQQLLDFADFLNPVVNQ
jgi:hypothetical protein